MTSLLIKNASQVVSPQAQVFRGKELGNLIVERDASIHIENGSIRAVGPFPELETAITNETTIIDAGGRVVMPGFVDSHSHLVFGGNRANEFAERCRGVSYEEIARRGGGIASTVKAIHQSPKEAIKKQAHLNLRRALNQGITTMEIKSGYGLSKETEIKLLEIITELKEEQPIELTATFLGAHAVPKGKNKTEYISEVLEMMPDASKYAQFCDVFCEEGYFSAEESKMILEAGKKAGMLPKMHVNQFHEIGGIQAAIEVGAVSADHLEVMNEQGIDLLAQTDIACTFLPGVSFFLNIPYAPARKMIDAGCIPALATDFNPGSSMTLSMQLLISMACTQMQVSVEEAICASTQNGALALQKSRVGCLLPGWQADLLILDTDNYRNMAYFFGENHIAAVIKKGKLVAQLKESA
ncbi:MAG: imidazolonepropionase [SAR324 cluster bacterium]|nr:imidazolonepropionase [SAR324 cluster bacterium]